MLEILETLTGVGKLITNITPHKASGPDAIPARLLNGICYGGGTSTNQDTPEGTDQVLGD